MRISGLWDKTTKTMVFYNTYRGEAAKWLFSIKVARSRKIRHCRILPIGCSYVETTPDHPDGSPRSFESQSRRVTRPTNKNQSINQSLFVFFGGSTKDINAGGLTRFRTCIVQYLYVHNVRAWSPPSSQPPGVAKTGVSLADPSFLGPVPSVARFPFHPQLLLRLGNKKYRELTYIQLS